MKTTLTKSARIYLAARYERREELCRYRDELLARGWVVTARWLDGGHQLSLDARDDGQALIEAQGPKALAHRASFAQEDLDDAIQADILISFTENPATPYRRGGRHVEFGVALAMGALPYIVGPRENIFHSLPQVRQFDTWDECLHALR